MQEVQFAVLHEFYTAARAKLPKETWDYLVGGAETETTLERNRAALDSIAFRPRVLRDVEHIDTGGTLLGHRLRLPVLLAPIGSLQDLSPGAGLDPSRAAARSGVMHMLSSVTLPALEEVAADNAHPKLFQLYVRGDAGWVDEYVARTAAAGYAGLCLTIDLDHYGRRERDLAKRYKASSRRGSGSADEFQARFTWSDIARIRRTASLPLVLKGIATAEDARIALDHGVAGIYVSNHGGRQLDHGKGAIAVLPEVVAAVERRAAVIVDGGFMRGTDIVKAMALGADAVGIGRLQGLAAAAAGEDGIVRMLEIVEDEVRRCLGLLGVHSFAELDASYLATVASLGRSRIDSAFPLLKEGY